MSEPRMIDRLVEFINNQPADRVIKSHGSWARCAVGDFTREVLNHEIPDTMNDGVDFSDVHKDPVIRQLWQETSSECPMTCEMYGTVPCEDESLMDSLSHTTLPDTYGELAAYIRNLPA